MSGLRIEPLGEEALLLRFGDGIDPDANRRVHALAARIAEAAPPWLRELVPAYASLAVFVECAACERDPLADAAAWLRAFVDEPENMRQQADDAAALEIPVCYAPEHAPDLDALAAHAGLSRDAAIERHAGGDYRVAMIGFAPGFPYLLGLDPALAMPRLSTPRTRVPAGSVAIGGAQTGIYPRESPGGWHVIGRTPLPLFDTGSMPPALLAPGQRVRFRAIDAGAFRQWPRPQA